jgi:hypothetical protein
MQPALQQHEGKLAQKQSRGGLSNYPPCPRAVPTVEILACAYHIYELYLFMSYTYIDVQNTYSRNFIARLILH